MSALFDPARDLPRLRAWIADNGGEVLDDLCADGAVHYRSVKGPGSVVAAGGAYAFTGDGRLALSMSRTGGTLSPFAIGPEPALIHRPDAHLPPVDQRSRRARATVIADASVCPETHAAGWAAWMIADGRESATHSGGIEVACESSDEAETIAILEALRCAVSDGFVAEGAEVLIQSDSLYALAAIRKALPATVDRQHATHGRPVRPHSKARWSATVERTINDIRSLVRRHRLSIHVRHVPGHTAGDGRQWVNRRCDHLAKAAMRARRVRLSAPAPGAADPGAPR